MSENQTPTPTPTPHTHENDSMWKSFRNGLYQFKLSATDFIRLVVCFALMCIFFYPDWDNLKIVSVVCGFFVAITLISHVTRRLLLPYFSMDRALKTASETSLGAAIVVAAVLYLSSVMLQVGGSFFK